MTIEEIKKLFVKFSKTLDDKEKDEWWGTDRGIWNIMQERFLAWCKENPKNLN